MNFSRTKILPPQFRAGLIERTRLEQRLGAALRSRRLVLLIAPAGYGKTAALSREIGRLSPGEVAVWMTADEEDDLPRFIACLCEAIEPLDPPWRMAPEAIAELAASDKDRRTSAAEFLNALGATQVERGIIVLDNMQRVVTPQVFDFLRLVIDGLPPEWTVAIASREAPALQLARLQVRGELAEFGVGDLAFDAPEIQRMLVASGVEASPETTRRVYERTRGWAAGVALSLDGADASLAAARTSQRHLFDFLATEVFGQMSEDLKDFLLRCSVLAELTTEACAHVSGNPRAAVLLEDIENKGLFVSELEGAELTLRLHDLFRDFLADRLRRDHAAEIPGLLVKAAAHERDPTRKLNLLLRAGAWPEAEQVFETAAAGLLASGNGALAMRYLAQFPVAVSERSPALAFAEGLHALQEMQWDKLDASMDRAAREFHRAGRLSAADRARAMRALALLHQGRGADAYAVDRTGHAGADGVAGAALWELVSYWDTGTVGPPEGPARHLDRLVTLLRAAAIPELWYSCTPRLFMFAGRPGIQAPMARFIQGARDATGAIGDGATAPQAATDVLRAWTLLWAGRLDEARQTILQVQSDSQWLGRPRSLQVPLMRTRAIHDAMRGDAGSVGPWVDELLRDAARPAVQLNIRVMQMSLAGRCAAAVDDWPTARRALAALEATPVEQTADAFLLHALRSQVALHDGAWAQALPLLRGLVKDSASIDRMGIDAFAHVHLAIAELRGGSIAAAWEALAPIVARFELDGEFGALLFNGLPALETLAQAAWGDAATEPQRQTLVQWARSARELRRPADAPSEQAQPASDEARLTQRELSVLARLAKGESNKVIARELALSPHTVKRHVARILDRLGVGSRIEAGAWFERQARH